ncbi:MAG: hypothetical protein IJH12_02535 [Clostridia bacterium]|nr:hypothetical protein [Clostridia bacterium]
MKKIAIICVTAFVMCFGFILCNSKSYAYIKSDSSSSEVRNTTNIETRKENGVSDTLKEEKNIPKIVGIAILCGIVLSSIICAILVSKHKPVKVARTANNYLDKNKVSITRREDFFIRSTIDKQAR